MGVASVFALCGGTATTFLMAQAQPKAPQAPAGGVGGPAGGPAAPGGRATASPLDATKPVKLELAEGTTARFRVREQLAGVNFPSDAVGTTQSVTGAIVLNADGSLNVPQSKITVDLRTLKTDQEMRDGYVQNNTLETAKYPLLEFVPKRIIGLSSPLPSGRGAQAGFQIVGDMTMHGVTTEVTWNMVATFSDTMVAGHGNTTLNFAMFKMTKPSLARLLSVDDKIDLEIEFKCKRSVM
ncbi:MAG: YceI family protein [Acidobacteriota bacterium]